MAAAGGAAAFAAAEELLECVRQEVRGCKDIPRLQSAGALLCHLSVLGEPTRSGAFKAVLSLLGNRYPRVRKHIAEQFYLRLLSLEDEDACGGYDEDELEAAMEVVADTKWDGPSQEDIRAARLQVYPCFRIEPPQLKSKAAGGRPRPPRERRTRTSPTAASSTRRGTDGGLAAAAAGAGSKVSKIRR